MKVQAIYPRDFHDNSSNVNVLYVMFCIKPGYTARTPCRPLTTTARATVKQIAASRRETRVIDFQTVALRKSLVGTACDNGV